MKTTHWVLVANRSRALILRAGNQKDTPEIVQVLNHPEGRLHDGDLVTDQAGRVKESAAQASQTYAPQVTPSEHETDLFVKDVAAAVTNHAGAQPDLVVFAEPKLLGAIKAKVKVARSFSKDIAQWPDGMIAAEVKSALQAQEIAEQR